MKIIAANWKMHKTPAESKQFFELFKKQIDGKHSAAKFWFFPPALNFETTAAQLQNTKFDFGLQNAYFEKQGAFTGENSLFVSQQLGAKLVLVGHSERRSLFAETNSSCAKKIKFAQSLGLHPLYCIGESLTERESNQTEQVLIKQIEEGLEGVDRGLPLSIAYEPVWAIGTGKVATSEQVSAAHLFINQYLNRLGFADSKILYGGSVKPDNAGALGLIPHVSGFLIGGASLEVASLLAIAGIS